jgi:hypothetical protein
MDGTLSNATLPLHSLLSSSPQLSIGRPPRSIGDASAQSVEPIEAPVQSPAEVEVIMTKLGREAGAGVVVMPDTGTVVFRETIISLADRHRLPTIYPLRVFVNDGGLIYYGIDFPEMFRGRLTLTAYCGAQNQINFQFNSRPSLS